MRWALFTFVIFVVVNANVKLRVYHKQTSRPQLVQVAGLASWDAVMQNVLARFTITADDELSCYVLVDIDGAVSKEVDTVGQGEKVSLRRVRSCREPRTITDQPAKPSPVTPSALAAPTTADPNEVPRMVAEGQRLLSTGRNAEAVAILEAARAISRHTKSRVEPKVQAQCAFALAYSHMGLSRYQEAAAAFDEVLAFVPTHEMANAQLGQALQKDKRPQEAVARLRRAVKAIPSGAVVRMALALALVDAGHLDEACKSLAQAVRLGNGEARYALRLCSRQQKDVAEQIRLSKAPIPEQGGRVIQVERVTNLSFEGFYKNHVQPRVPVILRGGAAPPWDLDHVVKVCGHQKMAVKKQSSSSSAWAKLDHVPAPGGTDTVAGFVRMMRAGLANGTYLFDWGLPKYCQALMKDFIVPKYFAQDFLKRVPSMEGGVMDRYWAQWPALFIGPQGSGSGLHIDAIDSHFYMILLQGRKKWAIFPPNATAALSPNHLSNHLAADALRPDAHERYPLLRHVLRYECILEPGEIIFVPASSAHQVENLEDSLAVSGNYVDNSNWQGSMAELAATAQRPSGTDGVEESRHVLKHWQDPGFDAAMEMAPQDTPYRQTFPFLAY